MTSFEPLNLNDDINRPEVIRQMLFASTVASVGPMAAVACNCTSRKFLLDKFHCKEVIVENGGDIFIKNTEPITTAIYAGNSPLSGKIGLEYHPVYTVYAHPLVQLDIHLALKGRRCNHCMIRQVSRMHPQQLIVTR